MLSFVQGREVEGLPLYLESAEHELGKHCLLPSYPNQLGIPGSSPGAIFSADLWAYSPCFFFNDTFSDRLFLGFTRALCFFHFMFVKPATAILGRSSPTLKCRRILFKMKICITSAVFSDAWSHHWNFPEPPCHLDKPASHVYQTAVLLTCSENLILPPVAATHTRKVQSAVPKWQWRSMP